MPSKIDYNELDEEEKVALTVAIVYPHRTLRKVLPKLFKYKASDSTYYRHHSRGYDKLKEKGILDNDGKPTDLAFKIIPYEILKRIVQDLHKEINLLQKDYQTERNRYWSLQNEYVQLEKKYKIVEEENQRIRNEIEKFAELRELKEKIDFIDAYNSLKPILSKSLQREIGKAIEMFKREEYDSAIVKLYKVSEILVRSLFKRLYGYDEAKKVRKHEHRLQRIWNDEELEKHRYPGVKLIASLFSVILWYRNKMGAHAELQPTMEAARTSIIALFQSILELKRLGFRDIIST